MKRSKRCLLINPSISTPQPKYHPTPISGQGHAHIGEECNIGKGVYIGAHVRVGSRVKIQNYALVYEGVTLEDGVFVGPRVCFTNDLLPRAITPDGKLKGVEDWEVTPTLVKYGASIGAGAVILCGVAIGEFALVGAGSMVT